MNLVKWNDRDLFNLENDIMKLFNSFQRNFGLNKMDHFNDSTGDVSISPLTDIVETDGDYILNVDLPGMEKKDVKITFRDNQIQISGERKNEIKKDKGKFHQIERHYGTFFRSFALPKKIKDDKIKAEFKNGTLKVIIPKSEEVKAKEIEVTIN